MKRLATRVFFALGLCAGCSAVAGAPDSSAPPTLSGEDVAAMPPGTAIGTLFSGSYRVDTASLDACVCRSGDCSVFHVLTGASSTVTQSDGVLTSEGEGTCRGGIDSGGSYWCGEASQSGGQAIYGRERGQFLLVDGKPAAKQFTVETTLSIVRGGVAYDCDLRASGFAHFLTPSPSSAPDTAG